jgi:hypothetical protein
MHSAGEGASAGEDACNGGNLPEPRALIGEDVVRKATAKAGNSRMVG